MNRPVEWPLLSTLDHADQAEVVAAARRRTYEPGDVVVQEEDVADSLHLVVSGHLAVRTLTPDGETALLNVVGPGATIGELSLVATDGPARRSATVVALDAVETRVLTVSAFAALGAAHPGVYRWAAVLLAQRVRDLSGRVRDLMFVDLEARVCAALVDLAATYGGSDADRGHVVIPLTQEHLSGFIGGTRPSVNQVLQRLVADGLVELGRSRVTVLDRAALSRLAGRW